MKKEKDWIDIKSSNLLASIKSRCNNHVSYTKVTVCDSWLSPNNFSQWFIEQVEKGWYVDGWDIDKDIISSGGNIYSPDHCAFIPKPLNLLFSKAFNRRYKYFGTRGVKKNVMDYLGYEHTTFESGFCYDGEQIFKGEYDYELFAFFDYKWAFEEFVQNKAEELKNNLNPLMYNALISYRVGP